MALSSGMLVMSPDIGYEVLGKMEVGVCVNRKHLLAGAKPEYQYRFTQPWAVLELTGANYEGGFIRRDSSVGGICGDYP